MATLKKLCCFAFIAVSFLGSNLAQAEQQAAVSDLGKESARLQRERAEAIQKENLRHEKKVKEINGMKRDQKIQKSLHRSLLEQEEQIHDYNNTSIDMEYGGSRVIQDDDRNPNPQTSRDELNLEEFIEKCPGGNRRECISSAHDILRRIAIEPKCANGPCTMIIPLRKDVRKIFEASDSFKR